MQAHCNIIETPRCIYRNKHCELTQGATMQCGLENLHEAGRGGGWGGGMVKADGTIQKKFEVHPIGKTHAFPCI